MSNHMILGKKVKLTQAQLLCLVRVDYAKRQGNRLYRCVDEYKPAKKLVELGLIERVRPDDIAYAPTRAGMELVESLERR